MEQRMKIYSFRQPSYTRDDYEQEIKSYTNLGTIKAFITPSNESEYTTNSFIAEQFDYIGITSDKRVKRDDLIGNYEVIHVINHRSRNYLYLKEIKGR